MSLWTFRHSGLPRGGLFLTIVALLLVGVAPLAAAEPTGRLGTVSGTVAVTFANGSALQPAGPGTELSPGDRISTVGKSSASIDLPGVGRIGLAADTTVIIRELRTDGGITRVTVELVHGMLVDQLSPASDVQLDFRSVDPSGAAVARATNGASFGMGRDENGNVTVACTSCPRGAVTFPTDRSELHAGRALTLTARGGLLDWSFGSSVYDALAEGASADEDGGNTPVGNRLPPGQRTGSRDDRRVKQQDDDAGQNSSGAGAGTPTPTPTATQIATSTQTPTATPTPTPTTAQATIANFVYLPDPIQIHVGDSIRWTNLDNAQDGHTVTARDLSFTSPVLRQGDTYVRTFTQAGTILYFCEPHPFMTAFIDVQP